MLAHTPMVEREHRLVVDLDDDHIPYLHHWDSLGIDLFDTLPTAKNSTASHSKFLCTFKLFWWSSPWFLVLVWFYFSHLYIIIRTMNLSVEMFVTLCLRAVFASPSKCSFTCDIIELVSKGNMRKNDNWTLTKELKIVLIPCVDCQKADPAWIESA